MDIYLTDLKTGSRLRFPMLPDVIKVQSGAVFYSYQIINTGDVRLPSGEQLTGFSWSGRLPGEARKNDPYVREWKDPKAIQSLWSVYRAGKKKLRLLATETPVNHNVYLDSYSAEYSGGHGDYIYTISFIQAKDLKVYTGGSGGASGAAGTDKPLGTERPSPPPASAYTVVKGDSLWAIAQKKMGNGSRYTELYAANRAVIDPRNQKHGAPKYTVYPGQVLTMPS